MKIASSGSADFCLTGTLLFFLLFLIFGSKLIFMNNLQKKFATGTYASLTRNRVKITPNKEATYYDIVYDYKEIVIDILVELWEQCD